MVELRSDTGRGVWRWDDKRDSLGYVCNAFIHTLKIMTTTTTPAWFIAGQTLAQSLSQLEPDFHPVVIISAYDKALQTALEIAFRISVPIDTSDDKQMLALIKSSIGTKFVIRWADLMRRLALDAVHTVSADDAGVRTVDIKRYARVVKVPVAGSRAAVSCLA